MSDIYKSSNKITFPSQEVYSITKSIVIDSRQRDCKQYRNPSSYTIDLENVYKNVTSIELKGVIIPKSNYNVHSSNNKIDFAIGDSVTSIKILDSGSGYTVAPTVILSSPKSGGVTATATAIITAYGTISNIIIGTAGSGYTPSEPPVVMISDPNNINQAIFPRAIAIVGTHYTATLRTGNYDIGGNPIPPLTLPTSLLLEIQNSMNYAVNGGSYNPISTSPFQVRVVNQYPELGAIAGTPEAYNTNSCLFNRIQVINVNSSIWEFLFASGPNKVISSAGILGFNTLDSGPAVSIPAVIAPNGTLIPAGTAIRGTFDYNLVNDPDYVIMSIQINNKRMDRLKSTDDGLDDTFAVLLFDNNVPENLYDLSYVAPGSVVSIDGVQYLQGPTGKGVFWRPSGDAKPIKGTDFDLKKFSFKPPISSVNNITITFTKFGYKNGGAPIYYNMDGREHVLLFEFTANDQRTHQRE